MSGLLRKGRRAKCDNKASRGSGLTSKAPVPQYPSKTSRVGPVMVTRVRQSSDLQASLW